MSCYYKTLPFLIPELLLFAQRGSEVSIVSPWIENVRLRPPLIVAGRQRRTQTELHLSELLILLGEELNLHFILLLREQDYRTRSVTQPVRSALGARLEVLEVQHLHAKMLVTNRLVLETSANLLATSLYRNVESCQVMVNPYNNVRTYIREKLSIPV